MKTYKIPILILAAFSLLFISCEKDNYAAPSSMLQGRLMYQGMPINVEHGQVGFELWQSGFGKMGAIGVPIAQDGTFSSLLFDGAYKLVFTPNQGPFYWKRNASGNVDTVQLDMKGSKTMDIEVTPYYLIKDAKLTVSGKTVNASCRIEKIITDANAKNIERVSLYINKTMIVSGNGTQHIVKADKNTADIPDLNNVTLTANIPDIVPTQNYVFARIGLKIAGVEDMIFSPLEKLSY